MNAAAAPAERRRGDRRRGQRRGFSPGDAAPEFTDAPDSSLSDDSHFLAREAWRVVSSGEGAALPRILRTYLVARAALGLALVLAPFAAALGGLRTPMAVMLISLLYAGQAISMWVLRLADTQPPAMARSDTLTPRQWVWTLGVDLVAFSLLRLLDPAGQLNYAALLVLPVLMAGVLTPRHMALATTAAVVLVLLGGVWLAGGASGDAMVPLSQAGLAGAGMFVITLLASELAQRLTGEERKASSNLALARQQTQLNRLVIEEMTEGVLVVDRHATVLAVNPAARDLLGLDAYADVRLPLAHLPGLAALQQQVERAYQDGQWPEDSHEFTLVLLLGPVRTLQLRARFTRRAGLGADGGTVEDICVLFLEDMRNVQARLRQDKLAAMGRMSAGIAHEIRNPLAAIAQANALLLEDELMAPQQRLAHIVSDNVERLKRIIDDVLTVAAMPALQATEIDLVQAVLEITEDWRRTAPSALNAPHRLALDLPMLPLSACFDTEHLRRVLVNLLDNAARHASQGDGAVQVRLMAASANGAVALSVASDGEPIAPETERHLFEPFFSTRSRGSGLGLYICRELCARHGASIDYLPAAPGERHRNVFRIVMHRAPSAVPTSPTSAA